MRRAAALCLAGWLAAFALAPGAAGAHATLTDSAPGGGAQIERAPGTVTLRFDEPVEIAFGAVRVYDGEGERVDEGSASHPSGRSEAVAIALRDGLGDGTYTATYRVLSADSHPVAGGFVFSVGRGGTPSATVDELIDSTGTGPVTEVAFGAVRALAYLAIALTVGGALFLAAVWRETDGVFARRLRRIMLAGALIGISTSAAGIAFQGAVAAGTSLWEGLDAAVVGDVLETRFGTAWGLRLAAWTAVAAILSRPGLRLSRGSVAALALPLGLVCLTPALAGHASTAGPRWLALPASLLHVVSMSAWVGGILVLLLALPTATRRLEGPRRTRLIAGTVARFSTLALAAVAALIASGVVQAVLELEALADLTGTAFGRAVLVKVALLGGLVALGVWHRRRSRPRLASLVADDQPPGAAGVALRRALRAEGALMVAVLGVTAALVSYSPASGTSGPFATSASIGPARLELTVDPARAGRNEVHMYLFDRANGRQYDRTKELTVTARLPERSIGPLTLDARKAGPGHYVIRRAAIAPPGDWELEISARVTAFDAHTARLDVPIQ